MNSNDIPEGRKKKDARIDWMEDTKTVVDNTRQSDLAEWIKKEILPEGRLEDDDIPDVVRAAKENGTKPKTGKRRVRGKLSKKEIAEMKATHKSIEEMFITKEEHPDDDHETASVTLSTLEREHRLERVRLRRLEWERGCATPTIGGPCHQIGVGAPLQQINTRASPPSPHPTPLYTNSAHTGSRNKQQDYASNTLSSDWTRREVF